jgi:hypothetical protein
VAESLDHWRVLLDLITFGQSRSWTGLRHADVVVEPSFGSRGFGRPDAVALLEFDTRERVTVFFEAKLVTYAEASRLSRGRSTPGFNSSINGQLELNHRLGVALERWNSPAVLQEESWILGTPYTENKIRVLKNRDVLDVLLTPIARLPRTSYLHGILTTDSGNPFDDPKIATYMPEIFLPDAKGNQWATERKRFGWVGWPQVLDAWRIRDKPSWFIDTWAFFPPSRPVDDPAISVEAVPSDAGSSWTATRPARGVSLVFASRINSRTYLHFSWNQDNCALRDYSSSAKDLPVADRRLTHQVLPLIDDELAETIRRPPYTDTEAWHQRVLDANHSRFVTRVPGQ